MWAFQRGKDEPAGKPGESPRTVEVSGDHPIRCAGCLAAIAPADARIEVNGAHAHRCTNPAGYTWDIVCLREAPGCVVEGAPTLEHTWFAGFAWSYALCAACRLHLGWCFDGNGRFFGLIAGRLVEGRPGS